jgi:hypothetical protein
MNTPDQLETLLGHFEEHQDHFGNKKRAEIRRRIEDVLSETNNPTRLVRKAIGTLGHCARYWTNKENNPRFSHIGEDCTNLQALLQTGIPPRDEIQDCIQALQSFLANLPLPTKTRPSPQPRTYL